MIICYSLSGTQKFPGVYEVDLMVNTDYPHDPSMESVAQAPLADGLPPYTNMVVIENNMTRLLNDDENLSLKRGLKYKEISQAYSSYANNAVRYIELRSGELVPMSVSFDDIAMLERGYVVLSDFNDETNCMIKDHFNEIHKCSIAELGAVLKQCRLASMMLWQQKVQIQAMIDQATTDTLDSIKWILPENPELTGSWLQ